MVGKPAVLALDGALASLSKIDPRKGRVVELRYFGAIECGGNRGGAGDLAGDGQARLEHGQSLAAPRAHRDDNLGRRRWLSF